MSAPRALRLAAALLALANLAATLQSEGERITRTRELTIVDKTAFYPLEGSTFHAVGRALRANGILFEDGRDFRGAYTWRVAWRYRFRSDGYGCRTTDAEIELAGLITLPRWREPQGAAAGLADAWRRFEALLRRHEERHREITLQRARTLRAELMRLRAADCTALKAKVDAAGNAAVALIRQENAAYDAATRHGLTEGVRWPP